MKLLRTILPTLTIALVSGQSEDVNEDHIEENNRLDPDNNFDDDRDLQEINVGNGGNAESGSAFGPFGTTGDAVGGNGGNGNVVVSTTGWSGGWDPQNWCGDHWCGDNWCHDHWCHDNWCGDHYCHQNWCGDHWCRHRCRGRRRRPRCRGYHCHHRYPYYGGSMNVGNGGDARTGDAFGPFGTTGDAYGGHGGDGNVAVNGWNF